MKSLFEALPQLQIPKDLEERLEGALVKRASFSSDGTTFRMQLLLTKEVDRSDINLLERYITDQLLPGQGIVVRITEVYEDKLIEAIKPEVTPATNTNYGGGYSGGYRRKKNIAPEEGYGRDFEGTPVKMCDIVFDEKNICIKGKVLSHETKSLNKPDTFIVSGVITDYTDSIKFKIFANKSEEKQLTSILDKNPVLLMKGEASYDSFEGEIVFHHIVGFKLSQMDNTAREDSATEKRVELHCHTKMSEMDGVSDVNDIVKQAADFGHEAIAITDHGVVYSFPQAMKAAKECAKKGKPIKIIYGCEGYLVDDAPGDSVKDIMSKPLYHIILLAKNETGRINLYKMVSEAHLTYYHKRPRFPRSLIEECREGIIVGSACEAGELIRGIIKGVDEAEIQRRVKFYDYLEIQPVGNNAFMLEDDRFPNIKTEEDIRNINREVVRLGEVYAKPVVATCDVHFLNPEDSVYRKIIMSGLGYSDADRQPPLYLHTTDEMLEEFAYLGEDKAREVVVTNTKMISDMVEVFDPVRPDKCPPVIEGSEENLKEICYNKAHEMYGNPLPKIVQDRLDTELNSIIGNGYSVMYIFAQMLVKEANRSGYMVGSRGSVGSSFAATMADITEVNPLPVHYLCKKCKYSDFDCEEVKANQEKTGYDLPDKICPCCGEPLSKEGMDIPFETFLGFKGDKEPDIDLNFSSEYQSTAHAYTSELFGKEYTFKAGTTSTVADKTAYGFVKNYYEDAGIQKRRCEIERIATGCQGVRRTSGQHPGGIIVMPKGENIYSFTPIQHPANDMKSDVVTTHFEYHSIEHNLLKFDILGHDDPTMMKWLSDMTGIDPKNIPLDNPKLYELFTGVSVLGITPKDIGGTEIGTYGIPEFNTDTTMRVLKEASPKGFADLVNISGLTHGTDVWQNNARDLILSGVATLQTAICTRDGIMLDLISHGLEPSTAFSIMESVRKGKVADGKEAKWDEYRADMERCGIPKWYIGSCEKIKYMFPKAHAVAYVTMALRVAYFKLYHPLEFYAAFFGIRADGFDYEKMCLGRDKMYENLKYYRDNYAKLSKLEQDAYNKTFRPAEEMYARGYEFAPIDLYTADAVKFKVVDGKVMPSLVSIKNMGDKAAKSIADEAAKGKFLSKEDFVSRTKISKKLADYLGKLGILGDMQETNQISLFDINL